MFKSHNETEPLSAPTPKGSFCIANHYIKNVHTNFTDLHFICQKNVTEYFLPYVISNSKKYFRNITPHLYLPLVIKQLDVSKHVTN